MSPVAVRPSSSALARPKSVIQTTPGVVQQQVRRLDVAVDDAAGVGVGQPLRRLAADLRHAPEERRPAAGESRPSRSPPRRAARPRPARARAAAGRSHPGRRPPERGPRSRPGRAARSRPGRPRRPCRPERYRRLGREPAGQERLGDPAERGLAAGRSPRRPRSRPGLTAPPSAAVIAQPRQLVDDLVEPLALDELHGVVGRRRRPGRPRRPARCWCGAAAPRPSPRGGTAPAPCGRPRRGRAGPSAPPGGPG